MKEKQTGFIFDWINNWHCKDFALGFNLSSQAWNTFREYYLLISLGFWKLAIGYSFKKNIKL